MILGVYLHVNLNLNCVFIYLLINVKGKRRDKNNMDSMKIGGGLGIIKKITSSKNEKKIASNPFSSNPFGISFKGKVQTSDLFVSSEVKKTSILEKGKMAVSAAVASLTEIKNAWKEKIKPVLTFAKQTAEHITNLANKISDFKVENISLAAFKKETKAPPISRGAQKLVIKPVSELEILWEPAEEVHKAAQRA